ncbi:hypothetical protein AB3X52_13340 [Nocardioides sp. DS6]|uniref:Uncharacterized protein n=1 Tax=Nocardioides eburneus TaxID=3231482 RepID=A0ABV3T406_9ACTN
MGKGAVTGMNVTGLHGTGTAVAGRSGDAGSHANTMRSGVESAAGVAGHPEVTAALNALVNDHLLDPVAKLPGLIAFAGDGIANLAATGRDEDNAGGQAVHAQAAGTDTAALGLSTRINRAV